VIKECDTKMAVNAPSEADKLKKNGNFKKIDESQK
jgi:hypothetical protein